MIILGVLFWFVFGFLKLVAFVIGLAAVPLSLVADGFRRTPKCWWLWGNDEPGFQNEAFVSRWDLYVDRAWRNPVGNSKYLLERIFGDPQQYTQHDNFKKHPTRHADPMEGPGHKWRVRQVGPLLSVRYTWGEARRKGKAEVYLGFKIGSNVPGFGFTVQFRT